MAVTACILVAGGTGKVGRHIVGELVAAGKRVRILTRNIDFARDLFKDLESPKLIEYLEVDISKVNSCNNSSMWDSVNAVVSALGGDPKIPGSQERSIYRASLNLLENAQRWICPKIPQP